MCGWNWPLLFYILYFLDPRPESDAHIHMVKALCIKNFQLNLLLAPFSSFFFFLVDAIYYSNVGRIEPSGALLSLIILWD